MQLSIAFRYAFLTIAMTATCATVEIRTYEVGDRRGDKRLNRREATVVVEGPVDRGYQRHNVLYKKVAKPKYGPPKSKYGPPKAKYGPPPPNLAKKNKKHVNKTRSTKFRPQKGRYANYHKSSKRPIQKPVYGHPKKQIFTTSTNSYFEPGAHIDPAGFRGFQAHNEELDEYAGNRDFYKPGSKEFHDPMLSGYRNAAYVEHHPSGQGYAEPPIDSYGAPIKPNLRDLAIPNSNIQHFQSIPNDNDLDTYSTSNFAHKHRPDHRPDLGLILDQTKPAIFDISAPGNENAEMAISSYADIFNYKPRKETLKKTHQNIKFKNQWNGNHMKHADSEVIVGGQYAEPPARYLPKNNPSASMLIDVDDSVFASLGQPADSHTSAITSPYVNYKHSNMAFSPQNLNDAFSIIN